MRDVLLAIGLTLVVAIAIVRSDRKADRRNEELSLKARLLAEKRREEENGA